MVARRGDAPAGGSGHRIARAGGHAQGSALLDDLGLDLDRHLLADDHATGFEGLVVGQAELLAVELCGGGETGAAHAPWVGEHAFELELERDRLGRAVDREVAVDLEVVALDVAYGG